MHAALQLLLFWGLAFVTLAAALIALNLYYGIIGNDLTLLSLGQEAILVGVASLIEAGSLWAILTYVPAASRAMIFPAVIIVFLYKIAHLEDWNNYDPVILLLFQVVIIAIGFCLFTGHIGMALMIVFVVGGALALSASLTRNL